MPHFVYSNFLSLSNSSSQYCWKKVIEKTTVVPLVSFLSLLTIGLKLVTCLVLGYTEGPNEPLKQLL